MPRSVTCRRTVGKSCPSSHFKLYPKNYLQSPHIPTTKSLGQAGIRRDLAWNAHWGKSRVHSRSKALKWEDVISKLLHCASSHLEQARNWPLGSHKMCSDEAIQEMEEGGGSWPVPFTASFQEGRGQQFSQQRSNGDSLNGVWVSKRERQSPDLLIRQKSHSQGQNASFIQTPCGFDWGLKVN